MKGPDADDLHFHLFPVVDYLSYFFISSFGPFPSVMDGLIDYLTYLEHLRCFVGIVITHFCYMSI